MIYYTTINDVCVGIENFYYFSNNPLYRQNLIKHYLFTKLFIFFSKVVTCSFYDIISGDKINYTFWKISLIISRATKTSYTVTKWIFLQTSTLYMLCESQNLRFNMPSYLFFHVESTGVIEDTKNFKYNAFF